MQSAARRDLVSTLVSFGLCGLVAGSWISRIPAARDHLHASLAVVGLVLVCMGIGSFLTMPFGGRLTQRLSSRKVCLIAGIGAAVAFSVLPLAQTPLAFGAILFVAGASFGCWEVTLNVHGVEVERLAGRSVMPAMHGLWSGGLMVGSGIGALMATWHVSMAIHFWTVIPLAAVANAIATRAWRDHRRPVPDGTRRPRPNTRALSIPVILLATMLVFSNLGEGSASDWLALYAHDIRKLAEGAAAAAFTVYSVTSTAGRLLGGFVVDRLGKAATLRLSGVVTFAGIAVVVFLPVTVAPYIGAALWGIGLAVVFPTAMTIAGQQGGDNSAGAIAAVSTMGYGAFLIGPPLIGLIAEHTSLAAVLGGVMVLTLGITVLAGPATRRRTDLAAGRIDTGSAGRI